MVTFLIQAVTGMGRLLYTTNWGKGVVGLFGGYDAATRVHNTVGILMIIGFVIHIAYVLAKVEWRTWRKSLFDADSLVPRPADAIHMGQKIRWFFGLGPPPAFDRWTYWEKFDYWAVFWGMAIFIAANIIYQTGQVFYNAFLPDLAAPQELGRLSGFGWGFRHPASPG